MARARRPKSVRKKAAVRTRARSGAAGVEQPTPEMQGRVRYQLGQIVSEEGFAVGFAYRREPLIEAMASRVGLSPDEIAATRYYRTAFDHSERSPVKSSLGVTGAGTMGDSILWMTPAMAEAKRRVRLCERNLGFNLSTMRSVVLEDKSFSEIAIERFGGRVSKSGKGRSLIVPRSGRHREVIRREFAAGVRILTDSIRRLVTAGATEEIWVVPLDDGSAIIRRGLAAPLGRYRCWGDNVLVDHVIAALRDKHGHDLAFRTAVDAIAALKEAEDGRLRHLEPEELAA